jgi:8-oxo-dGTP diphosphatase
MEFHGAKVALLYEDQVLMYLRDSKPGLFNANMWDFAGGGREGDETPEECASREIQEEFGITLAPMSFIWKKEYPAQKDPKQKAYFFVGNISQEDIAALKLTEGQQWALISQKEFFERDDVIDALKSRFRDYLEAR